jgi:hypothetical protein
LNSDSTVGISAGNRAVERIGDAVCGSICRRDRVTGIGGIRFRRMAEGIKLKRGLIIEVNLDPMRGSETGKIRPCIIVTNNSYNERVPIIQVVPITAGSEKKSQD